MNGQIFQLSLFLYETSVSFFVFFFIHQRVLFHISNNDGTGSLIVVFGRSIYLKGCWKHQDPSHRWLGVQGSGKTVDIYTEQFLMLMKHNLCKKISYYEDREGVKDIQFASRKNYSCRKCI